MRLILLSLLLSISVHADYIPFNPTPAPFQTEKIPLARDQIQNLARDLNTLAKRPLAIANPSQERITARLLTLSYWLDPQSDLPLVLNQRYALQKGAGHEKMSTDTTTHLAKLVSFLMKQEQSPDAILLSQLLSQPLSEAIPDLHQPAAWPKPASTAFWQKSVAPIRLFRPIKAAPKPKETTTSQSPPPLVSPASGKASLSILPAAPHTLEELSIWPELMTLSVGEKTENPSFQISLDSFSRVKLEPNLINRLIKRAQIQEPHDIWNLVNANYTFDRPLPKKTWDSTQEQFLVPAAFLLRCIHEKESPDETLLFLAEFDSNQSFQLPNSQARLNPWPQLEALIENKKTPPRLILSPSELTPFLETLLVEGNEQFFLDHLIFSASDIGSSLNLGIPSRRSNNTLEAFNIFTEIRDAAPSSLTNFLINPHVIARLDRTIQLEPRFISAQLLLKRGRNQHNRFYSEQMLASKLLSLLDAIDTIFETNASELSTPLLEETHKRLRAQLDLIEKYVALSERETHKTALNLINLVRTVSRQMEDVPTYSRSIANSNVSTPFHRSYRELKNELRTFQSKLSSP